MRQFKKLLLSFILVCSILLTTIGCAPVGPKTENIDSSKTQLFISHYMGGVGNAWLTKIKTDFEEEYKDYQGVNGKVGVQIMINDHKKTGEELANDILASEDEIYFTDKSSYYDTISQGKLLDISSIVTEKIDGVSLEDRLTEQQKSYYKYNGKYYALPHYESFGGLSYNRNLFNDQEFFFAKGGCPSEFSAFTQANNDNPASMDDEELIRSGPVNYIYTNLDGDLSAGPDGKYGTSDDGLPATYDEFFALCDYMALNGTSPFIWSGRFGKAYVNYLLCALWADVDGADVVKTAYSLTGTNLKVINNIDTDVVENTSGIDSVTLTNVASITPSNSYLCFQTEGMYRAIEFVNRMLSKKTYYSSNLDAGTSHSHTDAQSQFVLSEFEPSKYNNGKYIAMIVEGNYWENEAKDQGVFNDLPGGKTSEDVSYAHLPLPKVDEARIGTKNTIVEAQGNISFIKSNINQNKKQLALDFLAYCYDESRLKEFTETTGVTRGLDYDLSSSISSNTLSDYAKSLIKYKDNADMVYLVSGDSHYLQHQSLFSYSNRFSINGASYLLDYLKDNNKNSVLSTKSVFKKLLDKRKPETWLPAIGE